MEAPKDQLKKDINNKTDKAVSLKHDIKALNIIEDKMTRAIAKKAFLASLKTSQDINKIIDDVLLALKESDKMNKDIEITFEKIKVSLNNTSQSVSENIESSFTIKSFNSVADKMARVRLDKINT